MLLILVLSVDALAEDTENPEETHKQSSQFNSGGGGSGGNKSGSGNDSSSSGNNNGGLDIDIDGKTIMAAGGGAVAGVGGTLAATASDGAEQVPMTHDRWPVGPQPMLARGHRTR